MRLTVNLEADLYGVAKSLSRAEDCTISAAVNRLLRRAVSPPAPQGRISSGKRGTRNGFVISHGTQPVTADTLRQIEMEDDRA